MNIGIVWFRRDLRIADHPALYRAAQECDALVCLYVDAPEEEGDDASRAWLRRSLDALTEAIASQQKRIDSAVGMARAAIARAEGGAA